MSTILPLAETTFLDQNGIPLARGKVYFFIPNTLQPKDTYSDSGLTVLNTNPIVLDAAGRAIIWGSGTYRQQVYDAFGDLIWDQITTGFGGGVPGIGPFRSVASATTITSGDYTIYFDASGGPINQPLPPVSDLNNGQEILLVKTDGSTNPVNVLLTGSDVFCGPFSPLSLTLQGASTHLKVNQTITNWMVL